MDAPCTEHANGACLGDVLVFALLEAAPDPMVIIRDGGAILHVNGLTEQMFGYPRQGLIGAQSELLFPVRYRNRHVAHRTAYFDTPRPRLLRSGMKLTGLRQDGTEFDADVALIQFTIAGRMVVTATIRKVADLTPATLRLHETLERKFNVPNAVLNEFARDLKRKKKDNELFVFDAAHGLRAPRIGRQGTVAN
jgi:PAS domain S-box-containing protein